MVSLLPMTAFDSQLNIATKASFFDCYNVEEVVMLTSKGYFALRNHI